MDRPMDRPTEIKARMWELREFVDQVNCEYQALRNELITLLKPKELKEEKPA